MSTFTEERTAKIRGNLALPAARPVDVLKVELSTAGVDPNRVSTEQTRIALNFRGRAIDSMSALTQSLVEQRSSLSFIIDALGPNGENILTEQAITLIRAAEMAQTELDRFDSSYERIAKLSENYKKIGAVIDSGLDGFEGIVGIVESRKLEGGGVALPFDLNDPRDARLAQTFKEYVDQWVRSQMGDPKLAGLSANELLVACGNFPAADRRAYDLSHPDQVGKVTGESLSYSIGTEFRKIEINALTSADGTKSLYKFGIEPGPSSQIATGPLDR